MSDMCGAPEDCVGCGLCDEDETDHLDPDLLCIDRGIAIADISIVDSVTADLPVRSIGTIGHVSHGKAGLTDAIIRMVEKHRLNGDEIIFVDPENPEPMKRILVVDDFGSTHIAAAMSKIKDSGIMPYIDECYNDYPARRTTPKPNKYTPHQGQKEIERNVKREAERKKG